MNNKIEMKMKKNQLTMLVLFATMLGFTACSDDDKVSISTVGITTTVDTTIEGLQLTGGTYTFENVNTSVKTDITYPAQSIELADGLYNVTFIGKGTYSQNGTPVEVDVQGVQQNVAVSGGSYKLELKVHVLNTGDPDFVIAEIFIPGTYNEAGKQYNGDQYVRIYNNSDKVLYADGLIFMESQFQTTQKYQSVDPDIMDEAIAVGSVVAVPGSGTDYPVQVSAIRTKLSFLDQSKQDLAIKAFQSLEGAYFPTEVEHFIYEEIIENSSLLYGPQTDFKKIWQDKLSALADKAWNDYHTQVTE